MISMLHLLSKWPLVRQIYQRKDGTGLEAMSDKTRAMHAGPMMPRSRARFVLTAAWGAAN